MKCLFYWIKQQKTNTHIYIGNPCRPEECGWMGVAIPNLRCEIPQNDKSCAHGYDELWIARGRSTRREPKSGRKSWQMNGSKHTKKNSKISRTKKQIYLAGKVKENAEKSIKLITTIITKADKKSIQKCACYPFRKRRRKDGTKRPPNNTLVANLLR